MCLAWDVWRFCGMRTFYVHQEDVLVCSGCGATNTLMGIPPRERESENDHNLYLCQALSCPIHLVKPRAVASRCSVRCRCRDANRRMWSSVWLREWRNFAFLPEHEVTIVCDSCIVSCLKSFGEQCVSINGKANYAPVGQENFCERRTKATSPWSEAWSVSTFTGSLPLTCHAFDRCHLVPYLQGPRLSWCDSFYLLPIPDSCVTSF